MAAATATSMATTAVLIHRLPDASGFSPLPRRPLLCSTPLKQLRVSRSTSWVIAKASSSDEASFDTNELFTDLKEKWDGVENKSTVLIYGGGAIAGLWLASVVVGAINSVPLLPKFMELVGLGYVGWFVYRYLLFKSSRKELATDIETLKKKISGTE